jgi:hypothetical protein
MPNRRWASHSISRGTCAEVASAIVASRGIAAMRDSMDPEGLVLLYSGKAWRLFVEVAEEGDRSAHLAPDDFGRR